ncbi:MAG: DMT family transporter [Parcubacteria group bacterium]
MKIKGIIYLGFAVVAFAISPIIEKIGVDKGVEPSVFAPMRTFIGLCLVAVFWFSIRKKKSLKFDRKYTKNLIIIGFISSGLFVFMFIKALSYTTATNMGVMQGMYAVASFIFAYFMIREKLPRLFFPILTAMIIGVVLLTSKGLLVKPNIGDWILFATIPLIGFSNVYMKKTSRVLDAFTITFGRYIFGALFLLFLLPFIGLRDFPSLQNGLAWVIISGVLGGIIALGHYQGIQIVGPTLAATMLIAAPALTTVLAFFILDETLNYLQLAGLILILGGALFITRFKARYERV